MSIREQLIDIYGKTDEQTRKLFDNVTVETFPITDNDIEEDIQKEIDTEIENGINNENEKED